MTKQEKNRLQELFAHIEKDCPSMGFEHKLMVRINEKKAIAEKRRGRQSTIYMLIGVAGVIILPIIALYLFNISVLENFTSLFGSIFDKMSALVINPMIISIAVVFLLLLVVDMLIRKRIKENDREHQ